MFFNVTFGLIPLFIKQTPGTYDKKDLVSIVIPVFNDGDILEQNLQNLTKLNYINYEIIVVYSEKSTDRTEEVALKFAQEHDNIRALSEDISKAYALNLGIDNSKGEFILFLDSDIFIYDGFIEKELRYFSDVDVKLVNSCFLGFNASNNLITMISWAISNVITFYAIGTNKFLKNVSFMGFGGMWRKSALIESGKFAEDSIIEDAELNLRVNSNFPKWKGVFTDEVFCYQFYPTDSKTLYLQQMRWNLANIKYTTIGTLKLSRMGFRQKILYISSFLMVILFPMVTLFSMGMIVVQFFANFFAPNFSFGGGLFFFLLAIASGVLSFSTMFIFVYPKYRKDPHVKLSRKFIIFGIFVIMFAVGLIFGLVSLNSFKDIIIKKKSEDLFVKVDKSDYKVPDF